MVCSLTMAAWTGPALAGDPLAEDAVKAAFALRFAGYVEWPEEPAADAAFTIVVLGASEISQHMKRLAEGRTVMNRPVQIRRIMRIEDVGDAQLLYIGSDRRGNLRELLAPLQGRSVLVVSDEENALESGGMINLRVADRHVRFEVSLPAARSAHLKISSELLSLAVRVQK